MVRPLQTLLIHARDQTISSYVPLAIGIFVTVSIIASLCAKHARRYHSDTAKNALLPSPKKIIASISNKAMMVHAKKSSAESNDHHQKDNQETTGLWQKAILMGERCQPPDFSGVIYYDYSGNRIAEMPKSPRASSLSPLRSFNFQKNENSVY